jgi:transcriptional regulator with XRE-family HTH domain
MENKENIGEYLRKLRGEISRYALSFGVGVSITQLRQLEIGVYKPRPETLLKLAEYYDVCIMTMYYKAGYIDDDIYNKWKTCVEATQ